MTPFDYFSRWAIGGVLFLICEYFVVRAAILSALRAWRPF